MTTRGPSDATDVVVVNSAEGPDIRVVRAQLALATDPASETTETARRRANHVLAGLGVAAAVVAVYDIALLTTLAR